MTKREKKARKLCEYHRVDPDGIGIPVEKRTYGSQVNDGKPYKLWEYWAMHFVDVLENEDEF